MSAAFTAPQYARVIGMDRGSSGCTPFTAGRAADAPRIVQTDEAAGL